MRQKMVHMTQNFFINDLTRLQIQRIRSLTNVYVNIDKNENNTHCMQDVREEKLKKLNRIQQQQRKKK